MQWFVDMTCDHDFHILLSLDEYVSITSSNMYVIDSSQNPSYIYQCISVQFIGYVADINETVARETFGALEGLSGLFQQNCR